MKLAVTFILLCTLFPFSASSADIGTSYDNLKQLEHARSEKLQKLIHLSREEVVEIATYIQKHGSKQGYFSGRVNKPTADNVLDGELLVSGALQQPESELSAALNPTDTSQWIVSPINVNLNISEGHINPIYYSHDFGTTWQTSSFRPEPAGATSFMIGGGDPVFVFDKNGRCFFTWLSFELDAVSQEYSIYLYWAYSDDGGVTWTRPENDVIDEGDVATTFVDKQWVAADVSDSEHAGNIYCVYTILNQNVRMGFKTLEPGELVWSDQVSLYGPEYNFEFVQFSSIDTDLNGNVHVTFVGKEVSAPTGALYYTVSDDGGKTFADLTIISEFQTPNLFNNNNTFSVEGIQDSRLYPCPHIAVDKSGGPFSGTAYAAWTANGIEQIDNKGMDVFYSYKRPGGNWMSPQQVHDIHDASNQFYSSIAVTGRGDVVMAWYDQRDGAQNTHYRMAVSRDGGASFGASFELSTTPMNFPTIGTLNSNFGIGEYNQIMTTNYYAIPVWADGRKGNGDIDIYAATVNLETSSVDDYSLVDNRLTALRISPNPVVNESIELNVTCLSPLQATIALVDIVGSVIAELNTTTLDAGSNSISLRVDNVPNGSYRVVVQTEIGAVSELVVLNR